MNPMPMNTAPMITITNKQTHPKMMHGKSPMQYHQISPQAAHVSHPLSLLFILNKEIDFLKSKCILLSPYVFVGISTSYKSSLNFYCVLWSKIDFWIWLDQTCKIFADNSKNSLWSINLEIYIVSVFKNKSIELWS